MARTYRGDGDQSPAGHAQINFKGQTIADVIEFDGKKLVVTDSGIKGVNTEGTENPANDIKFDSLSTDKIHMMIDRSPAVISAADNSKLLRVYGDANATA